MDTIFEGIDGFFIEHNTNEFLSQNSQIPYKENLRWKKNIQIMNNYQIAPVKEHEFFVNLPQQIQKKMINQITKLERKFFHMLFKDPDTSYKVPIKLVSRLLSNITCEDCNDSIIVKNQ